VRNRAVHPGDRQHARDTARKGFAGLSWIKLIARVVTRPVRLTNDVHTSHACAAGNGVAQHLTDGTPNRWRFGTRKQPTTHHARHSRPDVSLSRADAL